MSSASHWQLRSCSGDLPAFVKNSRICSLPGAFLRPDDRPSPSRMISPAVPVSDTASPPSVLPPSSAMRQQCAGCTTPIDGRNNPFSCHSCGRFFHRKCSGVPESQFKTASESYLCSKCEPGGDGAPLPALSRIDTSRTNGGSDSAATALSPAPSLVVDTQTTSPPYVLASSDHLDRSIPLSYPGTPVSPNLPGVLSCPSCLGLFCADDGPNSCPHCKRFEQLCATFSNLQSTSNAHSGRIDRLETRISELDASLIEFLDQLSRTPDGNRPPGVPLSQDDRVSMNELHSQSYGREQQTTWYHLKS